MSMRPAHGGDDWVERVRSACDIVEVVGQSVTLKRAGRNWVGLCPFHKEKTPSFSVNAERQFYHSFSCKAGGDVFRFVQESEKVGFLEAVEMLSRRTGIPIPERRPGERGMRTALLEALELATEAFEQWLADPTRGAAARALLERRGVSREMSKSFRLGFAPAGWENLIERFAGRVPDDVLLASGLVRRRDNGRGSYDYFRERLMVPLVAPGGAVVGFGARAMGDETPKYLNSPETPVYHKGAFLFALEQARKHVAADGELVLVEGYFDVIAMHQAGLEHTVATSGTALTAEQARLIQRVASRVALTYDGDDAGREAMLRSLGVLLAEGLDVAVVELPAGEDPDTLVRGGGSAAWQQARASARDPVAFIHAHVLRASGPGDARERGLQMVARLAAQVQDPIRHRLLLERGAAQFGVPVMVLSRAAARMRSGERTGSRVVEPALPARRAHDPVERGLLAALVHQPEALDGVRTRLAPADFRDGELRALATWLWDGGVGWPEEESLASLARELRASGGEHTDWLSEVEGATRQMAVRRLRGELQERRDRLGQVRDDDEMRQIQHEIIEIARSLHELSA